MDQKNTMEKVRRYCEVEQLSRSLIPYLYSYDPKRNFLFCRNHKVEDLNYLDNSKLNIKHFKVAHLFGSDRSPRSQDVRACVRASVRPAHYAQ